MRHARSVPAARLASLLLVAACVALAAGGCTGASSHSSPVVPAYDPASGRLTRLAYDSDADGKADMVASMDGRAVRVVEVDEDHDGQVDRWEHYGGEAGDANPRLDRVERVTRRGDRIVRRETFEHGVLVSATEDRDADGREDRWETYAGGTLSLLAIDTDGTGRADRRLRYRGENVTIETGEN